MSDESFFREVNEEIRHDRTRELWAKFGKWLIAGTVIAVAAAAAYVGWEAYRESQANASGDRYLAALDLASDGKFADAARELDGLVAEGFGAYPSLARMRIATVRAAEGNPSAAVAAFDEVAGDEAAPQPLRDMAAVRAAYVLVDSGSLDDIRSRVERLTGDAEPLRFAAREALGLASWKAGDLEGARRLFEELRDDGQTPGGMERRAGLMLELIAAAAPATPRTPLGESAAPAAEASPALAPQTAPAPAASPGDVPPAAPAAGGTPPS